jgi:hypothetical protein
LDPWDFQVGGGKKTLRISSREGAKKPLPWNFQVGGGKNPLEFPVGRGQKTPWNFQVGGGKKPPWNFQGRVLEVKSYSGGGSRNNIRSLGEGEGEGGGGILLALPLLYLRMLQNVIFS